MVNGPNMYAYCGNNAANFVDPWGLDIWVGSNTGWNKLHRHIAVGNRKGSYRTFTFGLNGPSSSIGVNALNPLKHGTIYESYETTDKITDFLETTLEQDSKALDILDTMSNDPDLSQMRYGIDNTCRDFSEDMFDFFKDLFEDDIKDRDNTSGGNDTQKCEPDEPTNPDELDAITY